MRCWELQIYLYKLRKLKCNVNSRAINFESCTCMCTYQISGSATLTTLYSINIKYSRLFIETCTCNDCLWVCVFAFNWLLVFPIQECVLCRMLTTKLKAWHYSCDVEFCLRLSSLLCDKKVHCSILFKSIFSATPTEVSGLLMGLSPLRNTTSKWGFFQLLNC